MDTSFKLSHFLLLNGFDIAYMVQHLQTTQSSA